ncbi:MAG: hypothetical protein KDI19_08705 [Pseudomonadales bacterium]|nr:hypothetical protein [Pseudomonadales bacterium]
MNIRLPAIAACLALAGCEKTESPPPATQSGDDRTRVEVIATGSRIAGANGVHFGPDGNLYVASVVGSDITVIDPESGDELKRYTARDGITGPDDLAFSKSGTMYWTSILTGEVAGLTPDGNKIVAAQLEPGPNPITFSPDDRLFVSQCFLGDKLYELDPVGARSPRLISDSLGPGCGLNGMDWGPDDRLYGPRWFTGEVVSFNVDDKTMRVEATGLETPASVKFDKQGHLHVLDTGTGDVIRIDGTNKTVVAHLEKGLDNFDFDDKGRIFVSSFADGFVKRVDTDGSMTTLQPAGMSHAGGIAISGDTAIVADLHAIRGYNIKSGEETFVQRAIVGVSEMGGALNVAQDGENLILTSWFDGDVRVWDPVRHKRIARYEAALPVSAVRYHGEVVVAEHGKHRVVGLRENGEEIVYASDLPAPTGLVVEQGDLYLSDRQRGQILMIASDGKPLPEPYVVADNLTTPEGFVVTPNGFVVVEADTGHVVEVDSAGNRTLLAEIPPGTQAASPAQPPSQVFQGIASAGGALYVTGETNHSLYRITPAH